MNSSEPTKSFDAITCDDVTRRLITPARRLLATGHPRVALVHYVEGLRTLLGAIVLSPGDAKRPVPPPELERSRHFLSGADQPDLDRLNDDDAEALAVDFDRVARWALIVLNPPLEATIRLRRQVLRGIVTISIVGLVAATVWWFCQAPNVALGRHASASSTMRNVELETAIMVAPNTTPQGAVDGVRYGFIGFHSGGPEMAWWSVDLGRAYRLESVKIYGRPDCCFDMSIPLALEVSLDGPTFRQVAVRTNPFSQSDPWIYFPADVTARFVRLRLLRESFLVLDEVEIYGRPCPLFADGR